MKLFSGMDIRKWTYYAKYAHEPYAYGDNNNGIYDIFYFNVHGDVVVYKVKCDADGYQYGY